jgi:hypothetical protein
MEPAEIIYCSEMGRWAFRPSNIYKEESDHVNNKVYVTMYLSGGVQLVGEVVQNF